MRRGFTLIELLISIVLMVILLAAATLVFVKTTDLVMTNEARTVVYTNARYALDLMEKDLLGCLPFSPLPPRPQRGAPVVTQIPATQSFWMENGKVGGPGAVPIYNTAGHHVGDAADRISFRAVTTVGDTLQLGEVTYELIPGSCSMDATGALKAGDDTHKATVRTNRALYTLVRRIRVPGPANPTQFTEMPKDSQGATVDDTELCHYVLSFNLEYFADNSTFSQLEPSYFTSSPPPDPRDPLGNGQGANDGIPYPGTPYRVSSVRATLLIVEDVGERQERTISKVMWIPVG